MASLEPLRHPLFRRLVAARTITVLGNAVAPLALAFAVLDLTGSVTTLGLVVGVRSVANVAFLLLGGVIADRFPRQRVLVWSSLGSGLSQAAVATLVLTGAADVPLLLALGAVNGALVGVAFPASAAVTPQTVPAEVRRQANALLRLASNAVMMLGAVAGGALVATVGPGWGLTVDAASFLVSGALFATVRVEAAKGKTARSSVLADLRKGWREFTTRTWVWVVVLAFMVMNAAFVGGFQVLGPPVADRTFGRGGWGLVLASETAGMLIGGVLALRWAPPHRPVFTGTLWALGSAPLLAALGVAPYLGLLLAVGFLCGIGIEQFAVAWETSLQEQIPADRLARVYSYDMLGSLVAIPLGQITVGPIAAGFGTTATLLGTAGVTLVAGLATAATPSVRTVRRKTLNATPTTIQ
jgi:hypothetical protein